MATCRIAYGHMYDNVWPYADLRMAIRGVHMVIRTAYIWPYAFLRGANMAIGNFVRNFDSVWQEIRLRMAIRNSCVWPYATYGHMLSVRMAIR